ncbi:MAG: hypothetical protein WA581_05480, partial [Candidatus Acidiferrales bacterium]
VKRIARWPEADRDNMSIVRVSYPPDACWPTSDSSRELEQLEPETQAPSEAGVGLVPRQVPESQTPTQPCVALEPVSASVSGSQTPKNTGLELEPASKSKSRKLRAAIAWAREACSRAFSGWKSFRLSEWKSFRLSSEHFAMSAALSASFLAGAILSLLVVAAGPGEQWVAWIKTHILWKATLTSTGGLKPMDGAEKKHSESEYHVRGNP